MDPGEACVVSHHSPATKGNWLITCSQHEELCCEQASACLPQEAVRASVFDEVDGRIDTMLDTRLAPLSRECAAVFHAGDSTGLPAQERAPEAAELDIDQTLVEATRQALRATGYPALRDLDIEVCGRVVVLGGRVPSYHQKQLAQSTAQRIAGGRGITNAVEVISCR